MDDQILHVCHKKTSYVLVKTRTALMLSAVTHIAQCKNWIFFCYMPKQRVSKLHIQKNFKIDNHVAYERTLSMGLVSNNMSGHAIS